MIQIEYDAQMLARVQGVEYRLLQGFLDVCERVNVRCFAVFGTAIGAVRHGGFIPWDDDLDMGMLRPDYERLVAAVEAHPEWGYGVSGPGCSQRFYNLVGKFYLQGTVFHTEYARDDYPMGINLDIFVYDELSANPLALRVQNRWAAAVAKLNIVRNVNMLTRAVRKDASNLVPRIAAGIAHGVLQLVPKTFFESSYERVARQGEGSGSKVYNQFNDPWTLEGSMSEEEIFPLVTMDFGPVNVPMPAGYDAVLRRQYGDYMELPPVEVRHNHHPYRLQFEPGGPMYGTAVDSGGKGA